MPHLSGLCAIGHAICQSLVLSVELVAEHEGHGTIHATSRNQSAVIVQVYDTLILFRLQSNSHATNLERERNSTAQRRSDIITCDCEIAMSAVISP